VEEVLLSPTLVVADGRVVELSRRGSVEVLLRPGTPPQAARAVAHEDIWSLGQRPEVSHAVFLYRLHDCLMAALRADGADVTARLAVPAPGEVLGGADEITVAVCDLSSGAVQARRWGVDHHREWVAHGLNGVQVQTARGVLFAMSLLQRTPPEALQGTFTASTLPDDALRPGDVLGGFAKLGIDWRPVPGFRLPGAELGPVPVHVADTIWG
jgi:hypothetical protein